MEKCQHCGNEDADWCINPYDQDMYGTENYEWICSSCYNSFLGDI